MNPVNKDKLLFKEQLEFQQITFINLTFLPNENITFLRFEGEMPLHEVHTLKVQVGASPGDQDSLMHAFDSSRQP